MTITFTTSDPILRLKTNDYLVFYTFSTGDVFSNTFPLTTPNIVEEILKWGQDKCTWFDERQIEIENIIRELEEQPVVEVVEEVITE